MFRLIVFFVICASTNLHAQKVTGIVTDEDQNPIPAVLVFNLKTEAKSYSNALGEFSIDVAPNDEIRFVRSGFERSVKIASAQDYYIPLKIVLQRTIQEIEVVNVPSVRLTGDLNKDAKNLATVDKIDQLNQALGVPPPPAKPREVPADVKRDVLLSLASLSIKPQAIYDLISGDARRMKAEYRYEDLQDNIKWVRDRVSDEYLVQMGIPEDKISAFIQFSIGTKPELVSAIKARNVSKVLLVLEETYPLFSARLK